MTDTRARFEALVVATVDDVDRVWFHDDGQPRGSNAKCDWFPLDTEWVLYQAATDAAIERLPCYYENACLRPCSQRTRDEKPCPRCAALRELKGE